MNRYALVLAQYLLRRRAELDLTVGQAAERAGITSQEWISLERGHLPHQDDDATFNALADAVEGASLTIAFLACVAEYNRNR